MKAAKNIALIFILLISILLLSGCGGGAPTAEQISQTALQPSTQTTQTTGASSGPVRTPIQLPQKFKVEKTTPKFMVEALQQKKPLIVFFYKQNDELSTIVKENIRKAMTMPQSSMVIFLALNIEKPEHISGLVDSLGVTSVPFLAFIDSEGTIVKEFSGYTDEKTLKQAIYDLVGVVTEPTQAVTTQGSEQQ